MARVRQTENTRWNVDTSRTGKMSTSSDQGRLTPQLQYRRTYLFISAEPPQFQKSAKICKNLGQLKSFKTWTNLPSQDLFSSDQANFICFYVLQYVIQHCFICRPSHSTVVEDAGIEPRIVATCRIPIRHFFSQSRRLLTKNVKSAETVKEKFRCL